MQRILKWTVPVDDKTHPIGAGTIVHIASQTGAANEVQVWTQEDDSYASQHSRRVAQIYGTGHWFPDYGVAVGSAVVADGALVWHIVTFGTERV